MALRSPGIGDLEGLVDELVHRKLEAAEEAVERWGSRGGFDARGGGVSNFPELAAAVRELISLSSDGGSSGQRAKMALQATMVHLEDEFRQVLISSTYFLPPDSLQACLHDSIALPARSFSFSSFPNLEALSISSCASSTDDSRTNCSGFTRYSMSMEKVHLYLIDPEASILPKETAELIILAGHAPNLCHVYSETRHNTLVQCLCLLGVQSEHAAATAEDGCNMQLDSHKVKMWIQGLKIFVGTVLPEERHACAHIFGCNSMVEQDCFTRATTRCIQQLLVAGSAIAQAKEQHYEKVPLILQMHEELSKLQPSLQDLLFGDAKDVISQEVSTFLGKLGEAALGLLLDFLSLRLNHDLDEHTALDGNILSLTQNVMGFTKVLAEYNGLLNLILPLEEEEDGGGIERTAMAPWELYVLRLLSHLQLRIVEKSEFYKDESLRYIFLMNNAMYVLEHSRSLALRTSLRDNKTHEKLVLLVEEYATAYLRATWFPALFHLNEDRIQYTSGKVINVNESLKNFNSAFGKIIRVQTTWKVPNPKLRQHLRIIILNQVFPAYHTYVRRYRNAALKNIKYIPNDIENLVLDLFEG
ncbi:Exocyst complex component EXO70A1 [Dichanthelium oligosanthes]|uniref:Exocyst subunit Exo70 family protein n=1 Tax=Dichanthelium oligosanthes TaxID=888268 RepID=A0A1E5V6T5_9POAL|nr:Exocyst complex component EXO70A1 [Dichanthelium oligosanthes]